MNEYSGFISITALAVSALSGLYLNSKIESLSQRVTAHEIQLQDIRGQITENGKQSKQAIDITAKHANDIASLNEDINAVSFQACGPEFIMPSAEMQMNSYGRRSSSYSMRGRNGSRMHTPVSPRPALAPSDIGTHASQMS
jgi:hypothetical protein